MGEMWGQLKRGFEVLALGEMCFEGMGGSVVLRAWRAVEKGVEVRCWQLETGFEVLALGEMCFEGMGAVEKGV